MRVRLRGSMGIAETSVIVSGAVGGLGLVVPLFRARIDYQNQRRSERRALLDSIIDDCCKTAVRAEQRLPGALGDYHPDKLPGLTHELIDAIYDLNVDVTRLASLVGPGHEMVIALTTTVEALSGVHEYLAAALEGGQSEKRPAELRRDFRTGADDFLRAAADARH